MSYEACIVCDRCGSVICAASTATKAREENRQSGGRNRGGRDVCAWCIERCKPEAVSAALNHRPASAPDDASAAPHSQEASQ